jgi:hypothetical protein
MRDHSLAVIFTIIFVFLLGVPGLACLCLGLSNFFIYYGFNNPMQISAGWSNIVGMFGVCIGFFLILITIIAGYFLLHRKAETPPTSPNLPLPPTSPSLSVPPSNPDEPLPPTI